MAQAYGYGYGFGVSLGTYGTPMIPTGTEQVGLLLPSSLEDTNDSTLVRWSSNGTFGYAINDPRIPTNSTGNYATIMARHSTNIPSGSQYYFAKYRSAPVYIGTMSGASDPVEETASSITDGNGNALTPANFAATYWGVWADGYSAYLMRIQEMYIVYNFNLPVPTFTTVAASGVSTSNATLNATVDPNTANATWPVTYYFEWGTSPSFGNTTSPTNLTGSGAQAVSYVASGLSTGQKYYFRVRGSNADSTYIGTTLNFTAGTYVPTGRMGFASL